MTILYTKAIDYGITTPCRLMGIDGGYVQAKAFSKTYELFASDLYTCKRECNRALLPAAEATIIQYGEQ